MALHLDEISRTVAPGAHAVLLLDQAGWHLSDKLAVPENITLVVLSFTRQSSTAISVSGSRASRQRSA
jgi:hypothetical protein